MTNPSAADMDDDAVAAEAARLAAERRTDELHDIGALLDSKTGRRVLRRILDRSGPLQHSMRDSDRATVFREGQRDIGLWILAELAEARPESIGGFIAEVQKPNRLDAPRS